MIRPTAAKASANWWCAKCLGSIERGIFPFSLFQTSHKVRPFYEKLGATLVTNRIVDSLGDDPMASPFWDEVALRYPKDRPWPEGEIDLRGPGY